MLLKRCRSAWRRIKRDSNIKFKCESCSYNYLQPCPKISCYIYNIGILNYCYVIKSKSNKK